MTASLISDYPDQTRRLAARIDVSLAGGLHISNWRAGYTNLSPGETHETIWTQSLPAQGSLLGINLFELVAQDVTPAPFNQPPYPPAGDRENALCQLTCSAP